MAAKSKKSAKAKPAKKRPSKAKKPASRGATKAKPMKVARKLGARQAWAAGDAGEVILNYITLIDTTGKYTCVMAALTNQLNQNNWGLLNLVPNGGYASYGQLNPPTNIIAVSVAAVAADYIDYPPAVGMAVWDSTNCLQNLLVNITGPGALNVQIIPPSP